MMQVEMQRLDENAAKVGVSEHSGDKRRRRPHCAPNGLRPIAAGSGVAESEDKSLRTTGIATGSRTLALASSHASAFGAVHKLSSHGSSVFNSLPFMHGAVRRRTAASPSRTADE